MKKKAFCYLLLTCLFAFSLGACKASADNEKKETAQEENTSDSAVDTASEDDSAPEDEALSAVADETAEEPQTELPVYQAAVEEQTLFDENGLSIVATGLDYENMAQATKVNLNLRVTNQTENELELFSMGSAVNGYMTNTSIYNLDTDDFMEAPIPAGGTENLAVYWYSDELESLGITDLALLEFGLSVKSGEDYLLKSQIFSVSTSIADSYEQNYDDSGDVVYDDGTYRMIAKGVTASESYSGMCFSAKFYLENNSDKEIDTYTSDETVNGYLTEGLHYLSYDSMALVGIWPGHKSIQHMTFYSEDLEEGTEEIKTLDMNLVWESEGGHYETETTPVSITYSE